MPVETAQALLDSICFTLGLDLEDPGERGRELLARDLAKELTSRRERLRGEMVRGNILWVSLCRALPPVKNRAMQDTLRSIGGFWRRYDFVYLAQEIPCDIDYQLALPVPERMQGVRYVKEYLRRLSIENHFLRRYTWADLVPVLERYHPWYQEEVCNLFLPVAVNALGKALLGAAPVPVQGRPIRQSVCASMAVSAVCSLRDSGRVLRIRHQRVMYFMRLNSALNG